MSHKPSGRLPILSAKPSSYKLLLIANYYWLLFPTEKANQPSTSAVYLVNVLKPSVDVNFLQITDDILCSCWWRGHDRPAGIHWQFHNGRTRLDLRIGRSTWVDRRFFVLLQVIHWHTIQQQEGDWVRPDLCKLAQHGPWPVRKRFIRDHVWRGRSKYWSGTLNI